MSIHLLSKDVTTSLVPNDPFKRHLTKCYSEKIFQYSLCTSCIYHQKYERRVENNLIVRKKYATWEMCNFYKDQKASDISISFHYLHLMSFYLCLLKQPTQILILLYKTIQEMINVNSPTSC